MSVCISGFARRSLIAYDCSLSNQIQVPFLDLRNIYTIRERPSRMYSWTALITAQYLTELPWNILGSSIFFLCWFFTVGFPTDRAGYTYFMIGLIFPAYYTSIGKSHASCIAVAVGS